MKSETRNPKAESQNAGMAKSLQSTSVPGNLGRLRHFSVLKSFCLNRLNGSSLAYAIHFGFWPCQVRISDLGFKAGLLAAALVAAPAFAQSNGIPGPSDYASFSRFITDRNIFDPNRQPHYYDPNRSYIRRPTRINRAPAIQFVGTMSYEKGMFGFFSGNSVDLSKVLQVGDKLQGYTITDIVATNVVLESADHQEQMNLQIGDGLRQENNKWLFSKAGELPLMGSPSSSASSASSSPGNESNSSTPAAAPPSAGEQNDILKRLMQQREKESQ
jgi:hypothetical protein